MSKRILLIEDDEFLRDIYKRSLTQEGFLVDVFTKGLEGLAALEKNDYQLVLLDIMLPDTNGLEVLKKIKSSGKSSVPVVFLTNLGQEAIMDEGYKLGAKGYLIKSTLNPDQVVSEVKNFLAG